MKTASIVLGLSIAANVALGALLLAHRGEEVAKASAKTPTAAVAAATAPGPGGAVAAGGDKTGPAAHGLWSRLHPTGDLAALVTRLRQAGFPPVVIRRVMEELVKEQFDAKRLEIEKASFDSPYWEQATNTFLDPKIGPALRKLQVEQVATLMKLLGEDVSDLFADTEDGRASLRLQIGDIPDDKLYQFYQVWMDFADKRAAIFSGSANGGPMLPADRAKAAALEKEMSAALGQFLTPAQVTDFMMRNGTAGSNLRQLLGPFKPSEDEFRALYPLYQSFADQFPAAPYLGKSDNLPADQAAARTAALDTLGSQVKAALGDQRAADFQQAMDPQYYQLNRLVGRLDLPLSAATQVSGIQQDVQQRAEAIRNDPSLAVSDRTSQLAALANEASTKISNTLGGQRGLDAYKQYGGQWLLNLVPRRAPKG